MICLVTHTNECYHTNIGILLKQGNLCIYDEIYDSCIRCNNTKFSSVLTYNLFPPVLAVW